MCFYLTYLLCSVFILCLINLLLFMCLNAWMSQNNITDLNLYLETLGVFLISTIYRSWFRKCSSFHSLVVWGGKNFGAIKFAHFENQVACGDLQTLKVDGWYATPVQRKPANIATVENIETFHFRVGDVSMKPRLIVTQLSRYAQIFNSYQKLSAL